MPDLPVPILYDTDIGDDIDDAWALSVCVRHPRIELLGVTTVHRDSELRAAQARLLLELAGAPVEVAAGARDGLDRLFPQVRNNQADVLSAEEEDRLRAGRVDGVRFLAEKIAQHPGCTLLPVGPFTNVGRLIAEFPEAYQQLGRLVIMGGHVRPDRPDPEYNACVDPRATRMMFESGKPLLMVGLDVTLRCVMTPEELGAIDAKGTPLSQAIMAMTRLWQQHVSPPGGPTRTPCIHDPLAALVAVEPSFVRTEPMCLTIDEEGRCVRREGEPNVEVAVDVEPETVRRRIVDLIG
ncbi:MAG: nucleoside hydrolase [Armatimonadetes bacterium]|nr:nucleoside hydrolase [Armatimonadota bacterium]